MFTKTDSLMPKVSVMMCVHNAEEYIKDCLDSIFCQSFGDFELVVVDDGSTDSTMEQVKLCSDNRIRIIQKEHDYIGSLNAGLDACTGEYIARMDADDLMHPDRLQVQVALMDSEPSVALCACWVKPFGEGVLPSPKWNAPFGGYVKHPFVKFIRGNYIHHPAVMLRRSVLEQYGLRYNRDYPYAEDYKLWTEMAKKNIAFFVSSQPLLYYQISKGQVSFKHKAEQRKSALRVQLEVIRELIGRSQCKKALEKVLEGMQEAERNMDDPSLIPPYFFEYFSREGVTQ